MKIIAQWGLLLAICWASLGIERALPFTLPANIIGMILLLALLLLRWVRANQVRETADFLLGNLPFFFVPAVVSIINYMELIRANLLALVAVCVLSLVATFAATVWAVRLTMRWMERRRKR